MAKGFKHGGGGGSASAALNFKIVGGTAQPAAPSENTIWVNTEEEITSWVLSPVEPEAAEGLVWISIGSSSAAAFNALQENGIMIYPMAAKQYVGGAWVSKTAQSCQNGAWVDWLPDGAIYYSGNEMEDITGGWTSYAYAVAGGYTGVESAITRGSENLEAVMTVADSQYKSSFVSTVNAIDLTDCGSVEFAFDSAESSRVDGSMVMLKVYNEAGGFIANGDTIRAADGTVTLKGSIDVSGLSGKYRVGYMMWADVVGVSITAKLKQAKLVR